MNDFLNVTVLAILQGVAEFLPVSSSGHLVIGQHLLGMNAPGLRLDVFLHVGTLLAIFAYYRKRLGALAADCCAGRRAAWTYLGLLALSTLPAALFYFCFNSTLSATFETVRTVGVFLVFTGLILTATRFLPQGNAPLTLFRVILMGCAQALALFPGVSRSGMTLAAARAGRLAPEAAAEFSFLMSTPLILGAALLELVNGLTKTTPGGTPDVSWGLTLYGTVLAALVGYGALALLVRTLKSRWFWLFGPYCATVGLLTAFFC
jgi:undecaprenyl-diphosphatase